MIYDTVDLGNLDSFDISSLNDKDIPILEIEELL
jgi:hypothetical protein